MNILIVLFMYNLILIYRINLFIYLFFSSKSMTIKLFVFITFVVMTNIINDVDPF